MADCWWVNQGQTYAAERDAGILWAPKISKGGRKLRHWESMAEVRPGDTIIHYADKAIRAVGEAVAAAIDAQRPSEVEGEWERDGRLVRCVYVDLPAPIRLADIPEELRTGEPSTGPFDRTGEVKEGYLYPVSPALHADLTARFGLPTDRPTTKWVPNDDLLIEAERFRLWRLTPAYWRDEVDYKAALAGVLRRGLSRDAIAAPGFASRLAMIADGKATPEILGLDAGERASFARWTYRQSWINLLGSAIAANLMLSALATWATEVGDAVAASTFGDLLYGLEDVDTRTTRFCADMTAAFRALAAAGKLRAQQAPAASLSFAAIFLGLIQPDTATLWRSGPYRSAAAAFNLELPGDGATAGEKLAASIRMQSAIRSALADLGIELVDLLEVHNFLWARDQYPEWGAGPISRDRQIVWTADADSRRWEDWRMASRVSYELAGLDDLRWYASQDKLPGLWLHGPQGELSVDEAWVLRGVAPGDVIAVASADNTVLGHGVATSTYSLDPFMKDAPHQINVHWRSTERQSVDQAASNVGAVALLDEIWFAEQLQVSDWWIFQANPELYRLGDAVRELPVIAYEVNQAHNRIHAEQRVFFYESGDRGGIVAIGTILTEPASIREPGFERPFWGEKSDDHAGQARLRVRVRIDHVLDPRLGRDALREHSILRDLPQLKYPAATNYHVEPRLAAALLRQLAARDDSGFARQWSSLVDWLLIERGWDTLDRRVRITLLDADAGRIRFVSPGPDARERTLTRQGAERAWDEARAAGVTGAGHLQMAEKALLAHLPNIEYSMGPIALHWVDPATHEVGTIKKWEAETPVNDAPRPVSDLLHSAVRAAGLWFEPWQIDDVYLALRTKPFLLLTGLSGTGKTQLARVMQSLLCDDGTSEVVSVRPDWTDGRSLLGYHNLLSDRFHSTPVTRFLLAAEREWLERHGDARPYILLLDEMNLARVEHYFADYLSALELASVDGAGQPVGHPIQLHGASVPLQSAEEQGAPVPPSVLLCPNVYVIGTVNVDETTHPFSRKVLDRATTVELFDVDLRQAGRRGTSDISAREFAHIRGHFSRQGRFADLGEPPLVEPWIDWLAEINDVLARYRLHVGYRVRNEVLRFVEQAGDEGLLAVDRTAAQRTAFDLAILQKVLPRLAGSRERLEQPLTELLGQCLEAGAARIRHSPKALMQADYDAMYASLSAIAGGDGWSQGAVQADASDGEVEDLDEASEGEAAPAPASIEVPLTANEVRLPRSAKKLARMLLQLRDEGYASFFE
jgi:energy-coupling factor transporter ATP-binding protein EcfA2